MLHCRVVYPPGLFRGIENIEVHPCGPSAGNVICLGSGDVVANAAEEAETIRELERQGVTVHAIDLLGSATLFGTLAAFLLIVNQVGRLGFGSPLALGLGVTAIGLLQVLVWT